MALDRPASGRIFFEQLIRDNIDIGHPDKVNIVFDRKIRLRGKNPTPDLPDPGHYQRGLSLPLPVTKDPVEQYLKEGRALIPETTLNQPRDFGIGKELTNLAAMAEVGYSPTGASWTPMHEPRPRREAALLEAITSPVISTTCTRIPRNRFPDPRVQALLAPAAPSLQPPATPAATCGTTSPPSSENARGHDRRPDQLRPAQAPRPPDHRAHPAQPQLPGHRRRPVHRPVPHPADPATPYTRPRPAHGTGPPAAAGSGKPTAPTAMPSPTWPARHPSPPYPPAAITCSNHEPDQPSHTPQLDSK